MSSIEEILFLTLVHLVQEERYKDISPVSEECSPPFPELLASLHTCWFQHCS